MSSPSLAPTGATLAAIAASHPQAKRYLHARRLQQPRSSRLVPVHGRWEHAVLAEHLDRGVGVELALWCPDPQAPALPPIVDRVVRRAATAYVISARTLARLQPERRPPMLLSLARLPDWRLEDVLADPRGLVLVADGIEYAGNLGSLIRTVDACGASGLVLTSPQVRVTHPQVFTASRGTVLGTPVVEAGSVAEVRRELARAGFEVLVADPAGATDYRLAEHGDGPVALVVGSESSGVSTGWRTPGTRAVAIPMSGSADSLNVAASAAVLLYDAAGRRTPRG